MSDIFISYSREDRMKAQQLAELLEQNHWSVWWDKKIAPGKNFGDVISEELSTAKSVIVLWSRHSVSSNFVKDEAQEAANRGVLIPLLIEEAVIPVGYRQLQAVNLSDWDGSASHPELQGVLDEISNLVGKPVVAATDASTGTRLLRLTSRRTAIVAAAILIALSAILIGYLYKTNGARGSVESPTANRGLDQKTEDQKADRARQLTQEGISHADSGNHKGAILAFDEAVRTKPDYLDAYFNRGQSYVAIHENESAIRDFSKVEALPEDDYKRKKAAEFIKAIKTPPTVQELNAPTSTPLGSQLEDMFKDDKGTRIAATTKLIIERKGDRDVVPQTISIVKRHLAEPDGRKNSNVKSGVINALVLFENIDPQVLRIHEKEVNEMLKYILEFTKGVGDQTNEHIGKVRDRLNG